MLYYSKRVMRGNYDKAGIQMKKKLNIRITVLIITALLLSALPITAFAENEYEITQMSAQGEIISDVNVRSGPGTDYDKIGAVREKEIVVITGVSADGWYQIEYDGAEGFIYGKYVTVAEMKEEEPGTEDEGEEPVSEEAEPDEEEVKTSRPVSKILKPIAVVVIIAVIVIMIFLTIRSLRQSDDSESDDEDDYDDTEYEYEEDDEYCEDEYEQEDEDDDEDDEEIVKTVKTDPQTIIIREEDYQLHIDPKYFEEEPITQPAFVTGYLKEKQEQEKEEEKQKVHTGDLQKAMDKLQELQEEIEKLKKNQ